ncbi:MAG TPA: efflux RND transporter periplasmic adaptor subunit, partial [Candidatus Methylomirabilis sp.]|nr:efflux RND transporter periplasmic adaptor subunit [Candidatus Methylomirabilis sp.]
MSAALITGGYLYSQSLGSRSTFRTAPVARGSVVAAISATGTLNAVITVQVGSQVSGNIKELYVDFNSVVKKGQVIARIDPELFQAQVNQAKAQVDAAVAALKNQEAVVEKTRADLANAKAALASAHAQTLKAQVAVLDGKRNLGRQQELRQKELIAQSDLDAAQVQYDSSLAQYDANVAQENAQSAAVTSAEAQLKVSLAMLDNAKANVAQNDANLRQAEINLEHTVIIAPVDGVVVSRTVDVGQTVAASLQAPTLFTIAQDLTKMQVDTNVAEADVGRVNVGQPSTFTVDAFPGRTFRGEVIQVRKAAQVLQNVVTYDVVVSAPNNDQALLPTMTANVRIVTDQKDGVLKVPNAALRFRPSGLEPEQGQRPGGTGGGGAPRTGAGPGSGQGAGVGQGAGPGQGPGGREGGGRGIPRARVWVVDVTGKPKPVPIHTGISDGTFTEVTGGDLTDQQQVIVGVGSGDRTSGPGGGGQGGPRLR